VPTRRSQIAFIRGASDQDSGAACLKYGVERGGEVRAAVADQERDLAGPLAGTESEIPGLLHSPPAGRAGSDAAKVHPAGAVLDEHQHVQALAQHGVDVQETDREDPSGLGVQELPPGAARGRHGARRPG
jgi:hypothetical protein